MLALLMVLIAVPIIELAVMVQVAGVIGVLPTVLLVLAISFAGAWLTKLEGVGVLRRMQAEVADGQIPATELVNGVLILTGGLLMLVPGFVTGVVGLLLLLPPVRALLRPVVLARARRRAEAGRAQFAVFSSGFGVPSDGRGPRRPFGGRVYDADAHLVGHDGQSSPPDGPRPPFPPGELNR